MKCEGLRTPWLWAMMAVVSAVAFHSSAANAADQAVWQPQQTQVFLVSLTRFKSERLHSFSTDDRLDDRMAQTFRDRGVPANQVVLLKDDDATGQHIKSEFARLLRQSQSGETLFFYFGSHGSLNRKTGEYSFCAFNENVSFAWVFDAIERDFRGTQAILTTDCCYSGGIVELALKRKTSISYACLSSTYSHQVARSGWRFAQCLIRGLSGNPVVDLDHNGQIDLSELAEYSMLYMAFVADGKPMFQTTGHFNPTLTMSTGVASRSPHVGKLLEVHVNNSWEKAEVLEANPLKWKLHFTKDTRTAQDAWFPVDRVRPSRFTTYAPGTAVEILHGSDGGWQAAKVLSNWESLHLCLQDGHASVEDEWYGPDRVRRSMAGVWSGGWRNSVEESGPETLDVLLSQDEKLSGTWSGNVPVKGERIGQGIIYFEGMTPDRFYRCAGRVEGPHLRLNYVAHRTNGDGHYYGWAELGRDGKVLDAVRDPRVEFDGRWTGTFENSRGGQGNETLNVTENAGKLGGDWSGVSVTGERLGDAMFFLEGQSGKRQYRVIGHVTNQRLVLDYSATSGNDRYVGRSMLSR